MAESLAGRVAAANWYHTIDLGGGIVTPGVYDLRPALARLPLPHTLEGMRCLDVGTRNGFYAFEMERRGAKDVVAIDVDSPEDIDLPEPRPPAAGIEADLTTGRHAFELAHEALGSSVTRVPLSVYDLNEEVTARFDFAIVGTLLWHLRDPVGALMAVRRVLDGRLLLNEGVSATMQALHPRGAAVQPKMERGRPFWWAANTRGLIRIVEAAGLDVEARGRPYLVPYGAGKPHRPWRHTLGRPLGMLPERLLLRRGAPQVWVLARPGPAELGDF